MMFLSVPLRPISGRLAGLRALDLTENVYTVPRQFGQKFLPRFFLRSSCTSPVNASKSPSPEEFLRRPS